MCRYIQSQFICNYILISWRQSYHECSGGNSDPYFSSWVNMDTTLTRRSPALPSRWVWDSGIAWVLWTLNPQHLGCRTLFLSCFCSWWNPRWLFSVHPKMSSARRHTHTQRHALKYFLEPGRHHNSCRAEKPKKIQSHVQKKNSLLRRRKTRRLGGKTLLNFTLEASTVVPYLCDSANTPGWKIWYHQQWRQNSRPQGGLLHHMKHDSMSDSVTLENQAWW